MPAFDACVCVLLLQVETVRQRVATREMKLLVSAGALERIAVAGYDPAYGARPVRRAVQTMLLDPLAQARTHARTHMRTSKWWYESDQCRVHCEAVASRAP
eukprot:2422185-Pleurochrysis_carterae.AAC.1